MATITTERLSLLSTNDVVDIGSFELRPENRCAFEKIELVLPVVDHKFEHDDKNLTEEKTGEVEIGLIEPSTGVVDHKFEYNKNLTEGKTGEVEKIGLIMPSTDFVDHKFEHGDKNSTEQKTGEVVDQSSCVINDPWTYDTIEVDEEEKERRYPLFKFKPKKPRTRRYVVDEIIYNREKDLYYYAETDMIRKKEESGKSKKNVSLDHCLDSSMISEKEESKKSKKRVRFDNYYGCDDDVGPSNGVRMITRKEESRKSKKSARGPNYIYWEGDAEPRKKKQKCKQVPKKIQQNNVQQGPPPELPHRFKDYIDNLNLAEPPLFVAQKTFTQTDVNPGQSRLLLPRSQIKDQFFDNFLREDEKQMLQNMERIQVNVVDDNMHVYDTLQFTRWKMQSNPVYVLTKAWNKFAADHDLEAEMVVQAWCFRLDSRICFCLAVDRDKKEEKESLTDS